MVLGTSVFVTNEMKLMTVKVWTELAVIGTSLKVVQRQNLGLDAIGWRSCGESGGI